MRVPKSFLDIRGSLILVVVFAIILARAAEGRFVLRPTAAIRRERTLGASAPNGSVT